MKTFRFKSKDGNLGPWYFTPDDETVNELVPNLYGIGCVKYEEGSIYQGPLFYDGEHFNKIGNGVQDFTQSIIQSDEVGGPIDAKLYKYVGNFDYRKTDWIYGNGVFYFVSQQNQPLAFIKGFFAGLRKEKEYEGVLEECQLLEGFTLAMEVDCLPHRKLIATYLEKTQTISPIETLFIGDSWFEFWNYLKIGNFQEWYQSSTALNFGIGGSTYREWLPLLPILVYPLLPREIIIHLGFNDMHYSKDIPQTLRQFKEVVSALYAFLPNTTIYVLAVCPSPSCGSTFFIEQEYNQQVRVYCKLNHLVYINVDSVFVKDSKPVDNLKAYFIEDGYHLNSSGYQHWLQYISSHIQERSVHRV